MQSAFRVTALLLVLSIGTLGSPISEGKRLLNYLQKMNNLCCNETLFYVPTSEKYEDVQSKYCLIQELEKVKSNCSPTKMQDGTSLENFIYNMKRKAHKVFNTSQCSMNHTCGTNGTKPFQDYKEAFEKFVKRATAEV